MEIRFDEAPTWSTKVMSSKAKQKSSSVQHFSEETLLEWRKHLKHVPEGVNINRELLHTLYCIV